MSLMQSLDLLIALRLLCELLKADPLALELAVRANEPLVEKKLCA
jgi:hypothetical protein